MKRALALARRGQGRVEPNPMVGCVIVRGKRIIGEGYHRRFGGPHAEVNALRSCWGSAKGATVYATLEPCCFHGKTPACTEALIAASVRRVVAAAQDPNARVRGRGIAILKQAGIDVSLGVCEADARRLIAPYVKLVTQKRPWVILKWAQSIDGKIATRSGDSKWISDETARAHAHRTRGRVDAIIVGVGTVLSDNPALTCRVGEPRRVATRVVLDTKLRTPADAKLVRTARQTPTWIICGPRAPRSRAAVLEKRGCVIQRVNSDRHGVNPAAVLDLLGGQQMTNVLIEGGGRVLGRFHDAGLSDEYHIYVAPILIGGSGASGPLHAEGAERVRQALKLSATSGLSAKSGRNAAAKPRRLGNGWLIQTTLGA